MFEEEEEDSEEIEEIEEIEEKEEDSEIEKIEEIGVIEVRAVDLIEEIKNQHQETFNPTLEAKGPKGPKVEMVLGEDLNLLVVELQSHLQNK